MGRWTNAKPRPRKSGEVIIFINNHAQVVNYSKQHDAFNAWDELPDAPHALYPTHWQSLPKAPEGYEYV